MCADLGGGRACPRSPSGPGLVGLLGPDGRASPRRARPSRCRARGTGGRMGRQGSAAASRAGALCRSLGIRLGGSGLPSAGLPEGTAGGTPSHSRCGFISVSSVVRMLLPKPLPFPPLALKRPKSPQLRINGFHLTFQALPGLLLSTWGEREGKFVSGRFVG